MKTLLTALCVLYLLVQEPVHGAGSPDLGSIKTLLESHKGQVAKLSIPGKESLAPVRIAAVGTDMVCLEIESKSTADLTSDWIATRCFPMTQIYMIAFSMPDPDGHGLRITMRAN